MTPFEEFWQAWPGKRIARSKCEKKYAKITDEEHKAIMLALPAQVRYRLAQERAGQFTPEWVHPYTFLNQERWTDEFETPTSELRQIAQSKVCIHCDNPVHGSKFDVCEHHFSFNPDGTMRADTRKDGFPVTQMRNAYPELRHLKTRDDCRQFVYEKIGVKLK